MDVNLPYVNLVFPVDKYDDRLLICFSSFLTYFKYRKVSNWIVVGNLNDKEEYIIKDYSYKYGIRNIHIIKIGCNKSYEELSKIGISFGFNNNEICYVADFKTEITKEFNPGVLINILNRDPNVKSIRFTGKDYKKIGKCNYKILNLTDRFSYDGNYLIKNGSGNDLIVDFKVDNLFSDIPEVIKNKKEIIIENEQDETIQTQPKNEPIKIVKTQKLTKQTTPLPYVTVVMTTHNRTNVACAVIDSLIKNLKYPKLKWCISDDRSDEGHVDKLVEQFKKNGINEVHVEKTNKERYGLGASLNNGLKYAWTNSDIVLTTEDDWILEKPLNITQHVKIIESDKSIAAIRLATLNYAAERKCIYDNFVEVYSNGKLYSVFNNQVALRHKRIYDKLSYYKDNCSSDQSEQSMIHKFNKQNKLKVLFPNEIKRKTYDDKSLYFIHIGNSTVGHTHFKVPSRYKYISNNMQIKTKTINIDDFISNSYVLSIDQKRQDLIKMIFNYYDIPIKGVYTGFRNNFTQMFKNDKYANIYSGALNCSLGHLAIIKMAKCLDLPFVVIFEDDAYPCIDIKTKLIKYLSQIPDDADIVSLGVSRIKGQQQNVSVYFSKVDGEVNGSQSYIIFKKAYNRYIDYYNSHQNVASDVIMNTFSCCNFYRTNENLFIQYNHSKSNWGCIGYIYEQDSFQKRTENPPINFNSIDPFILKQQTFDYGIFKQTAIKLGLDKKLNNIDKVILIGGNDSIKSFKYGQYIDNQNIVIRVNTNWYPEEYRDYCGTKTSFIVASEWHKNNNIIGKVKDGINIIYISMEDISKMNCINYKFTTGFISLMMLLSIVNQVEIFGFGMDDDINNKPGVIQSYHLINSIQNNACHNINMEHKLINLFINSIFKNRLIRGENNENARQINY